MTPPRPAQTAPARRELCSYCAGAVGSNINYALVSTYLIVFYTDTAGLSAAAAGTLLLIVRVADAFADIAVGVAADNTRSRHGKFRPYLLYGSPLALAACTLCFTAPEFSATGKLVYAFCTCLLWSVAYTLCDIPYWSLTPAMTSRPEARTRIVAASRTCAQAGFWLALVGAFPLVRWLDARGLPGWTLAGAAAGLLCSLGFWVTFRGVRERETVPRRRPQSLARVARLLLQNRPLRQLLGTCFLLEITTAARGALAVYYFKYHCGREDLVPVYMASYFTPLIAGCLLAPAACRRFGKAVVVRRPILAAGALTAALWLVRDHAAAMFPVIALIGLLEGLGNIARMSCLADCVEYGQLAGGERDEGAIFALNIIKTKLAGAAGGALLGWFLGAAGFQANTAQSPATLRALVLVFTAATGAALAVSTLPMRRYALDETRFKAVLEQLAGRKNTTRETAPAPPG
jgi:GPH family glycoside/pentoside/hexuronide:cation symporter/probable glucitol transport protein GutA